MSRIGRKPVSLPKGVTAEIDGHKITVKGPKGEISRALHEEMALALEDGTVVVKRPSDEARHKALHGLTRTLVANMVEGVTNGFTKSLEIQGVGYKAEPKPFGRLRDAHLQEIAVVDHRASLSTWFPANECCAARIHWTRL